MSYFINLSKTSMKNLVHVPIIEILVYSYHLSLYTDGFSAVSCLVYNVRIVSVFFFLELSVC